MPTGMVDGRQGQGPAALVGLLFPCVSSTEMNDVLHQNDLSRMSKWMTD